MLVLADETAYEIAMRRDNINLMRTIERYARISAFMQVRMSYVGLMGLMPRSKFLEKWVVLVPREPPPDAAPNVRVIHSQLLIFNDHLSHQPVAKVWVDGAIMTCFRDNSGDRYLLKLHRHHPNPTNIRVETDEAGLLCVALRESSRPAHIGQVARLMHIVNTVTQEAYAAQQPQEHGQQPTSHPQGQPIPEQQRPPLPPPNAAHLAGGSAQLPSAGPLAQSAAAQGGGCAPAEHQSPTLQVPPTAPQLVGPGRSDEEVAAELQQQEMIVAGMSHADLVKQLEGSNSPAPPPSDNPNPPLSVRSFFMVFVLVATEWIGFWSTMGFFHDCH